MGQLIHIVFGTPFLIGLALYAAGTTLIWVLVDTRLVGRPAIWARKNGAPGSSAPWVLGYLFAYIGMFTAVYSVTFTHDSHAVPEFSGHWTLVGGVIVISVVQGGGQFWIWLHNRKLTPLPPPAWFPVADATGRERYWNGDQWTDVYRGGDGCVSATPPTARMQVPPHV
jgi:hypothetical protein